MKIFFIEFFFRLTNFLYRKIYILKANFLCKKINTRKRTELNLSKKDFKKCEYLLPKFYVIRLFKESDLIDFHILMLKVKMGHCPLSYWKQFILPGGFWVIENLKTKKIVGTCFAAIDPNDREENIGSLEWLASDPQHKNLGIGSILASKISSRLIEENFKKLRLGTHANNNAVIRLYKRLGWKIKNEILMY